MSTRVGVGKEKTMSNTNSPLVAYTNLSPNNSGRRARKIDRITPHCVVGQCTAESLGGWFANTASQASANYGIDRDGRVGLYVDEGNRSWCSSSRENDQRAVTIECASDATAPYAFRDVVYQKLIELCVDICRRNGKRKLLWLGSKEATLAYEPAEDEMVLTVHRWFAAKDCPGEWLYNRLGELAEAVTRDLTGGDEGIDVPAPPGGKSNLAVRVLQSCMAEDGYWPKDQVDGIKSPEFRAKIQEYAHDVATC